MAFTSAGGFPTFPRYLTECLLSDIAENPASIAYPRIREFHEGGGESIVVKRRSFDSEDTDSLPRVEPRSDAICAGLGPVSPTRNVGAHALPDEETDHVIPSWIW